MALSTLSLSCPTTCTNNQSWPTSPNDATPFRNRAAGFKTFSARHVNERAGRRGVLWQRGYYEHIIRNEKALDRIRAYIANNLPVGG